MAEEYAAKMATKSIAELLQYVTGRYQYREDAVLAALNELAHRGQPYAEADQIRPSLEAAVREQVQQEQEARRLSEADLREVPGGDTEAATGPALYSPGTITLFSVLFSMLAGGVLLGLNLRAMGRRDGLMRLVLFMVLYLVGGMLLLGWIMKYVGISPWLGALFNLPAILAYVLWFWPRYVQTYNYPSRSWLIPFLICAVVNFGLTMLAMKVLGGMPGVTLPH